MPSKAPGPRNCELCGEEASIAELVRRMSSVEPGVAASAAFSLAGIAARGRAEVQAVVDAGAIVPIVRMLSSPHGRDAAGAAVALEVITGEDEGTRREVVDCGAVDPLVALLSSGADEVMSAAAGALQSITAGSEGLKREVVAAGAIAPLLRLLQPDRSPRARSAAARALWGIAAGSVGLRRELFDAGAVGPLVALLACATFAGHASPAMWCLQHIAAGDEAWKAAVIDHGAVTHFVRLLPTGSAVAGARPGAALQDTRVERAVSTSALAAVHGIAADGGSGAQALADAQGVAALVMLLSSGHGAEAATAAQVIGRVASVSNSLRHAVVSAGAVVPLASMLPSERHREAASADEALRIIGAGTESLALTVAAARAGVDPGVSPSWPAPVTMDMDTEPAAAWPLVPAVLRHAVCSGVHAGRGGLVQPRHRRKGMPHGGAAAGCAICMPGAASSAPVPSADPKDPERLPSRDRTGARVPRERAVPAGLPLAADSGVACADGLVAGPCDEPEAPVPSPGTDHGFVDAAAGMSSTRLPSHPSPRCVEKIERCLRKLETGADDVLTRVSAQTLAGMVPFGSICRGNLLRSHAAPRLVRLLTQEHDARAQLAALVVLAMAQAGDDFRSQLLSAGAVRALGLRLVMYPGRCANEPLAASSAAALAELAGGSEVSRRALAASFVALAALVRAVGRGEALAADAAAALVSVAAGDVDY